MPKVEVQLILNVEGHDGLSEHFEQSVDSTPTADGMKYFIEEGVNSLRAELLYGDFYEHLPSTEGLFPVVKKRSYTSNDLFSGKGTGLGHTVVLFLRRWLYFLKSSVHEASFYTYSCLDGQDHFLENVYVPQVGNANSQSDIRFTNNYTV
jgi:hypothetical protein